MDYSALVITSAATGIDRSGRIDSDSDSDTIYLIQHIYIIYFAVL